MTQLDKDTLPPELAKRFDKNFKGELWSDPDSLAISMDDDVKQFLAQALTEQRQQIIKQVEGMKGNVYGQGSEIGIHDDGFQEALTMVIKLLKEQ